MNDRDQSEQKSADRPPLSIVITSYSTSRFAGIRQLLHSIKRQTCQQIEVVFVADQSDELASAVETCLIEQGFRNFRVLVNRDQMGANTCRNIGVAASTGDVVGIVDDDVLLFPNWAEEMIASQLDGNVGVTGPAIPLWEDVERMAWFPKELYFVFGCTVWDWSTIREIRNVGGMNCSFRRDALLRVGGYDARLGPRGGGFRAGFTRGKWAFVAAEEIDLSLRVRRVTNGKIVYNPRAGVFHTVRFDHFAWPMIAKRCLHFGYNRAFLAKHYRHLSDGRVLRLELEHLQEIVVSSSRKFLGEVTRNPFRALKRVLTIWLGICFTGLGFILFICLGSEGTDSTRALPRSTRISFSSRADLHRQGLGP